MQQPITEHDYLSDVTRPHVQSFNYFLEMGLADAVRHLDPIVIDADPDNNKPQVQRMYFKHTRGFYK